METNQKTTCFNCSRPLPDLGYFCGGCLTQFKCKSCDSLLEIDTVGCIICGTSKEEKSTKTNSNTNVNTFRLHETLNDRTIEATFSDDVAKDLAATLRDAATARNMKTIASAVPFSGNHDETLQKEKEFIDAEFVNDENASPKSDKAHEPISTNAVQQNTHPSMRYIVMNNLPSSEVEWIVVYGFYSTNFGENTFTRKDIIEKYNESGRKTQQRIKNLTSSITNTVKGKYFNPINNEDYSITQQGIEKAKEIIARTSGSSQKTKSSPSVKQEVLKSNDTLVSKGKKKSSSSKSFKRLTDINFYPSGQKSLVDFIKDYKIKNDNERNLLFTHYLSETLKIKPITLNHLSTCYDEVNHKIPQNMAMSLANTKSRTGWLTTNNSNIEITIKGVNQIKSWNKKD